MSIPPIHGRSSRLDFRRRQIDFRRKQIDATLELIRTGGLDPSDFYLWDFDPTLDFDAPTIDIPAGIERLARDDRIVFVTPKPKNLEYQPANACPGNVIVVPLPADYAFIRAIFPTVDGTARATGRTEGQNLRINVPSGAISGEVQIYVTVPSERVELPGLTEVMKQEFSPMNTLDFIGGVSGFADFTLEPARRFRRLSGETLRFRWRQSNLSQMQVMLRVVGGDTQIFDVNPTDGALEVPVPDVDGPAELRIAVQAIGACDQEHPPFVRSLRPALEVKIDRQPHLTVTDSLFPCQTEVVRNFYRKPPGTPSEDGSPRLEGEFCIAYPESVPDVVHAVRTAEFNKHSLGVRSTGGSYESITFPVTGDWEGRTLIEPLGFLLPHGFPGLIPESARTNSAAFNQAYKNYLNSQANYIHICSATLRRSNVLKPSREIQSVLDGATQMRFENETGVSLGDIRERLVYVDAATRIWDVDKLLGLLEKGSSQQAHLTMPTAGASGFQSLAGAVRTGVHGSTRFLPPVSGFVRAIHLVSNEGYEWWIEPSSFGRRITENLRENLPLVPADATNNFKGFLTNPEMEIRYDNRMFDAALVGPGGIGVICGYVIEALPQYQMVRHLEKTDLDGGLSYLADVVAENGFAGNAWFPSATFASNGDVWNDTRLITAAPVSTQPTLGGLSVGAGGLFVAAAERLKLALIADFAGWMEAKFGSEGYSTGILVASLMDIDSVHGVLVKTLIEGDPPRGISMKAFEVISEKKHSFKTWEDLVLSDEQKLQRDFTSHEFVIDGTRIVDYMKDLMNFASVHRDHTEKERSRIQNVLSEALSTDNLNPSIRTIVQRDWDDLLDNSAPLVFQASVRFTAKSTALLGMQRWPLSAHIEVFSHEGLGGTGPLWRKLEELAGRYDARPHWGQKHESHRYDYLYPLQAYKQGIEPLLTAEGVNIFETEFGKKTSVTSP